MGSWMTTWVQHIEVVMDDEAAMTERARLERKLQQTQMRLAAMNARDKSRRRAIDTRRKILVGAAILSALNKGTITREMLRDVLHTEIRADRDKVLLDDLMN
jgi:hypothetical protein